ncbi:MAG: hypothetical protein ACJAYC_001902, partial [Halieaceae bacterium]
AVITGGVFDGAPEVVINTPLGHTLTITGVAGGVVSYTYTLNAAEAHAGVGEDSIFENFAVVLTDTDTGVANGTLTAAIVDDVPEANADGIFDILEDTAKDILFTELLSNDESGADLNVSVVGLGSTAAAKGVVTVESGQFVYTPTVGETGQDTFSYVITDADGDTSEAIVTVNLAEDSTPTANVTVAYVDDDGLDLPNTQPDAGVGDETAPNTQADESAFSGTFNAVTVPDDPASDFNFVSMVGITDQIGQEEVTYAWDNGTSMLTATISDTPVNGGRSGTLFTVEITDRVAGDYTLTLAQNVLHLDDVANEENDAATVNLQYTVVDSDGSPASGALTANFDDDVGMVGIFAPLEVANADNAMASGTAVGFGSGADGWQDIDISLPLPGIDGLTYDEGAYDPVTGRVTFTATETDGGDPVFEFYVEEDGDYKFTLIKADAGSSVETTFAGVNAGSPADGYLFGGDTADPSDDVFVRPDGGTNTEINPSTTGISGDANSMFVGEILTFEYNGTMDTAAFAMFGGGGIFTVTVWDSTAPATTEIFVGVSATGGNSNDPGIMEIPQAPFEYDRIRLEVTGSPSALKILGTTAVDLLLPQGLDLEFGITGTDNDGDTATITVSVTVDPGLPAAPEPAAQQPLEVAEQPPAEDRPAEEASAVVHRATDGVDLLFGTEGADVFVWSLTDNDKDGDVITGFELGTDVIDIKDILGEDFNAAEDELSSYLSVDTVESGGVTSTVLTIDSDGQGKFNNGGAEQVITIEGVDIMDGASDVNAALQSIIDSSKPITD